MKRRIILILIIVGVLGLIAGGIAWYVRANAGWRTLARAQLAMQADKFDDAALIAANYVSKYPGDWQGYYWQATALSRLGKYPEAREALDKVLLAPDRMKCDEVAMRTLRAETYAYPARRALGLSDTARQTKPLEDILAQFKLANDELDPLKDATDQKRLDVLQFKGRNLQDMGLVCRRLSKLRESEAQTAGEAGDPAARQSHQQESQRYTAQAEQYAAQATQVLLDVVTHDPSRATPARELVEVCIATQNKAALEEARHAILSLADPPPVAAAMLILQEAEAATGEGGRLESVRSAGAKLDEIIKKHPDEQEVKLWRADLAFRAGDRQIAQSVCDQVLAKDPRNRGARLLHARLLRLQGKLPEAEQELFTLKTDARDWPRAHYEYGLVADANGNKQLAREAMREAVRIYPGYSDALRYLASALRDDGFYDQAFGDAQNYLQSSPEDPAAIRLFVELANKTGQAGLAREKLGAMKEASAKYKDRPEILVAVADGYAMLGDGANASELLGQIAATQPGSIDATIARARVLAKAQQTAAAEKMLLDEIARNPSPSLQYALGQTYLALGRTAQAVERFRAAAKDDPKNTTYQFDLCRALLSNGELDECQAQLDSAGITGAQADLLRLELRLLRGEPIDVGGAQQQAEAAGRAGLPLAMAYLQTGRPGQCVETCQAELKKNPPDSYSLRLVLAQAYLALGQRDNAVAQVKEAITASPAEATAYMSLAALLARGDDGALVGDADAIAAETGKVPQARWELVELARGWVLEQRGKYEQAADCYGAITARSDLPEDIRLRSRLLQSQALARAGQTDKALAALNPLMADQTTARTALYAKAKILLAAGRTAEAQETAGRLSESSLKDRDVAGVRRAIEIHTLMRNFAPALQLCNQIEKMMPDGPQPYLVRAQLLLAQGDAAAATAAYEVALTKDPGNFAIYLSLANLLDAQSKPIEAMKVLDRLAARGPAGQSASLGHRAMLLARYGLAAQAMACLDQLGKLGYSNTPQVQVSIAESLASLGQKEQSALILKKIPLYAPEYVSAQRLLANMAEGADAKLAILADLDKAKPGQSGVLAERMRILLAGGKAADAVACFQAFVDGQGKNRPLPAEGAFLAVMAMVRNNDIAGADALATKLSAQTLQPQWRTLAMLLKLDSSPAAAAALLPPPASADIHEVALAICLASSSSDQAAMAKWADRFEQIEQANAKGGSPAVPLTPRLLMHLACGKTQQAAANVRGALKLAAAELVTSAKNDPKAASEAAALLKASIAAEAGLPALTSKWALDVLKARPTCLMAAFLAENAQMDLAARHKILAMVRPEGCAFARLASASLLVREAQFEQAIGLLSDPSADKNDPDLMIQLAMALESTGKLDAALPLYTQAWEAGKNPVAANNAAYLTSVLCGKDKAKLARARAMIEQAIAAAPNVAAFRDTFGWILCLQGDTDDACRELRQSIKSLNGSVEAHYHTGRAEAAAGNKDWARNHYEAALQLAEKNKSDGVRNPAEQRAAADSQAALEALGK